ncbi:MAG: TRAP transporter substrate-binding protein DctP [Dehalococcoidales bacterium]|nr:TRAP transporter substrate-binding protein DctP [Dehalococcoidales bacterium]
MKKVLAILIAVVLVAAMLSTFAACGEKEETQTEPTVLRLAVPSPKGDPIVDNIENFVKEFNEQAKGKYVIEIHPGESLIKMADSVDALRTGAVEIDVWPIGAFSNVDANFAAAELPFLVNSIEADAALQVETMPLYDSIMTRKFNIKPIYTHTCLGIDMISNKQVKTAADWKGMLVQSISPQTAKFIELMGGASVPMPFPDAYQGIQKNIISATLQSSSMMIAFKLNEVAKYVLRGYLTPAAVVVAINMDVYNKMPGDIQELLMKLGKKAQTDTNSYFVNVYWDNYKTITDMGMTVYNLPKAERDKWVKNLEPYCDELYSKMDKDFGDKLKDIGTKLDKDYPYKE